MMLYGLLVRWMKLNDVTGGAIKIKLNIVGAGARIKLIISIKLVYKFSFNIFVLNKFRRP